MSAYFFRLVAQLRMTVIGILCSVVVMFIKKRPSEETPYAIDGA
jgi:hypothetical protein